MPCCSSRGRGTLKVRRADKSGRASPEGETKTAGYRSATGSPGKTGQNCGKQRASILGKQPLPANLPGTRSHNVPARDQESPGSTSGGATKHYNNCSSRANKSGPGDGLHITHRMSKGMCPKRRPVVREK